MKKLICYSVLLYALSGCSNPCRNQIPTSPQSQIITAMIEAVNQKDAENHVLNFSEKVQVFLEGELKIDGRDALRENRAKHFNNHPEVRSEIQHLVEIDNKVIMHDKVWLNNQEQIGQDIIEVFTFKDQKVIKVDVIQPQDLFN